MNLEPCTLNLPSGPGTLDLVSAIARSAGAAIMEIYAGDFNVELKGDDSPLTCADKASHEVIVRGLQEAYPSIPILSEEGKTIPYAERSGWSRFWLVDPLDGTKEFIKRNGEFTVNIALVENGAVVAGVVYVPAQNTLYFGEKGKGAWKQEDGREPVRIGVREADCRGRPDGGDEPLPPVAGAGGVSEGIKVAEALPVGSSLKLCVVAEGKADLYPRLGPTMEWDTAAGHAVVEAAGGTVTRVDGTPLSYNKENLLNPYFIVKGR